MVLSKKMFAMVDGMTTDYAMKGILTSPPILPCRCSNRVDVLRVVSLACNFAYQLAAVKHVPQSVHEIEPSEGTEQWRALNTELPELPGHSPEASCGSL